MSVFITFEGGEGCGKSLQSKLLYEKILRNGIDALLTREPGGTSIGEDITRLLKWNDDAISPLTELFLFNASRSQLVNDVINPALKEGKVVVCDRFADSTTVYQGYGRGLDLEMVKAVNNAASGNLLPDLTILLDMPPEKGLERKQAEGYDRFEKEDLVFHNKIRQGFLKLAAAEPGRWLVVDAAQDEESVARAIWQRSCMVLPKEA